MKVDPYLTDPILSSPREKMLVSTDAGVTCVQRRLRVAYDHRRRLLSHLWGGGVLQGKDSDVVGRTQK